MKALIVDDVHPVLLSKLQEAGISCIHDENMPEEEVMRQLASCQGIIVRSKIIIDSKFIDSFPGLKFIGRVGAGMETIDAGYARSRGIACFSSPEGNRDALAEHAIGMLLCVANNIHTADSQVRSKHWEREANRGFELKGKTVGIIGYGVMGQAFADRLAGFSVNIIAYDKYKKGFSSPKIRECSLEEIQAQADIISFHVPQAEDTVYMCSGSFLDLCGKKPVIINTSRGKVVKLAALADALKKGKVRAACLDVLEYENYKFEKFMTEDMPAEWAYLAAHPAVVFTPHVGGWTVESKYKLSAVLADKIIASFKK
jgi:D-3-phosphoglycerate dehydrogenase / 2-oxoglutarate reductase